MAENAPLRIPIDGILDLHTFNPSQIRPLLQDYCAACRNRGIYEVRVIHGKGKGSLRRTVHNILGELPEVSSFRTAPENEGGWGATIARLKKKK